jgi:hypothetical protein
MFENVTRSRCGKMARPAACSSIRMSAKSSRFRCHLIKIRQLTGEEVIVNTASLAFVQATLKSHVEFIEHKIAVEESDAYRRKASAALS